MKIEKFDRQHFNEPLAPSANTHKIYTDGSGDGRIAWYNETTGESWSGRCELNSDRPKNVTNNEAEYLAIYNALKSAKVKDIEILSDSQLVVNQLKREWHIKDEKMRDLFDKVQELIRERKLNVRFVWIPREKNPAGKYLG